MKFLYIIILSLESAYSYSQDVFSIIEIPEAVDTGIAAVGLHIDNTSQFTFAGIDNVSTGIYAKTGQTGIFAETMNLNSIGVGGVSINGTGVTGISNSSTGAGLFGRNSSGKGVEGITFEDDPMYAGVKDRAASAVAQNILAVILAD